MELEQMQVGEEISDCYGFHYTSLARRERRTRLAKWFKFQVLEGFPNAPFQCECIACTSNFPAMAGLTNRLGQGTLELIKVSNRSMAILNINCLGLATEIPVGLKRRGDQESPGHEH
jgi:hypothetical protein